jgi:hypothetical protein
MDFMFDMFSLRNVNSPYTQNELQDITRKDHSIRDEDKQSRLKRTVSIHDIHNIHDNEGEKDKQRDTDTDTETETETQQSLDNVDMNFGKNNDTS